MVLYNTAMEIKKNLVSHKKFIKMAKIAIFETFKIMLKTAYVMDHLNDVISMLCEKSTRIPSPFFAIEISIMFQASVISLNENINFYFNYFSKRVMLSFLL